MKKIYLILVKTTWKDGKTSTMPIFAVENEKQAESDCKKMQTRFNQHGYENFFIEFYFYTEINLYF